MKFIFKYVNRHWFMFVVSILFLALESVADLLQPTFMSKIVDKGIQNADVKLISFYGLIMLAIACAGALFAVLRNYSSTRVSQNVGKEIRGDMYSAVQKLSLENIDKLQSESIITRITNDVNQVQGFVMSCMRMMVKSPITCIGAISLIIIQTPKQAPVLCVILAVVLVVIILNMKVSYPKFNKMQQSMDKLNGVTKEYLNSVRTVKAFTAEDEEIIKFNEASNNLKSKSISAMNTMAIFMPLINLVVNFGIVVLLFISKSDKSAQIGKLMASINYMTQVSMAMGMISNIMNSAVRAIASSNRIKEVMDEQPTQVFEKNPVQINVQGKIEFKDVCFAYSALSDVEVLKNINFKIEPGKTLGIIGPTGCGKSSLINLVPRFYDATKGCVLVDDVDVTKVDVKLLRDKIAVVPQKSLLFSGTIKDNLLWGKEDATDQEIEWACKIAQAEKFILEKDLGYQTVLSQGATNLSGGQKQRLSLARALLRKPKILILDDCTSALDASTESAVLKGLRELESCTVLLISQRISTVIRADKILCIDEGKIQGFGSHDELLKNCETYRKIYESQIGGV